MVRMSVGDKQVQCFREPLFATRGPGVNDTEDVSIERRAAGKDRKALSWHSRGGFRFAF